MSEGNKEIVENLNKAAKIQRRGKKKALKTASELGFQEELTLKSRSMLERMISDGRVLPETTKSGVEASRDLLAGQEIIHEKKLCRV